MDIFICQNFSTRFAQRLKCSASLCVTKCKEGRSITLCEGYFFLSATSNWETCPSPSFLLHLHISTQNHISFQVGFFVIYNNVFISMNYWTNYGCGGYLAIGHLRPLQIFFICEKMSIPRNL